MSTTASATTGPTKTSAAASANGGQAVDLEEIRERATKLVTDLPPRTTDRKVFRRAQFDAGLAWVNFPAGKGGLGASPKAMQVVDEVLRAHGVSANDLWVNPMGIGMAAPTILAHGSDELHELFLRRIFTCDDIWCQLFSEPSAGSDVATLSTRAVRDGDEWIVNGQKVWTTLAHVARYGMLVARTDPDQPKHRGLTYFVVDMHQPGVDVRPLVQITGEAEFNEVFFTDARIPDAWRLGPEGKGWDVAITTLMNERVALGGSKEGRGSGPIQDVIRLWDERRPTDAVLRDRYVRTWIKAECLRLTNLRAQANRRRGGEAGPGGSVGKLISAELNKEIYELAMAILGSDGLLYPEGYKGGRPEGTRIYGGDPRKSFLRSRANSIEGGTSEVMRNILGERVLGLPGEPRVDRDLPWTQIPK